MEELWLQLRGLVIWYAKRYIQKFTKADGNTLGGIELDDLIQSGYIAVDRAVNEYDSSKGTFTAFLAFYIKNEFREAAGTRTDKQLNDPINKALSLDAPLSEDNPEGDTQFEFIPDPYNQFDEADERIFQDQLHEALENAINSLPDRQAQTIRAEYWDGCSLKEIAQKEGISVERVRQIRNSGLQNIRANYTKDLEQFIDFKTPYYKGNGPTNFNLTKTSGVERLVLWREQLRKTLGKRYSEDELQKMSIWNLYEN